MKKKKFLKILIILFRVICVIAIIFSSFKIIKWLKENGANKQIQKKLLSEIQYDSENNFLNIDFSKIKSINPDTVAWIQVNGTDISYSVVQGKDNDFYLTHSFDNSYNSAGWIFADYRNKFDGTDNHIIIYGHNRRNGTMFSSLKNVITEKWYKNEDNLIVNLYTPNELKKYKVFSVHQISENSTDLKLTFNNDEQYTNYLNELKNASIYNFNEEVSKNDKILTLYTCADNNSYRILLHAKLINNN